MRFTTFIGAIAACVTLLRPGSLTAQMSAQDLSHAREVSSRNLPNLLGRPGVMGGGVGASQTDNTKAVIHVYVHRDTPAALKAQLPTEIEGVPVELVETGPIKAR